MHELSQGLLPLWSNDMAQCCYAIGGRDLLAGSLWVGVIQTLNVLTILRAIWGNLLLSSLQSINPLVRILGHPV